MFIMIIMYYGDDTLMSHNYYLELLVYVFIMYSMCTLY